jgi:KUP system potassium uptake protein
MHPDSPTGTAPAIRQWPIALAALGVVFGDIGTSPLYAFRECFNGPHALSASPTNLVGAASLIVWTLVLVVTIKYLSFILRLDNKGEGGILALAALVRSAKGNVPTNVSGLFTLGIFGATLIYADGMLTPAISVLSAVEGLSVGSLGLEHSIVPVTVAILVGLFAIQRYGTGKVGALFGPVLVIWFTVLGGTGISGIMNHPQVLLSLSPHAAGAFLIHQWHHALPLLAAVFLAVTGGEALYADLGHFGRHAIRVAWLWLVFPGLVLNYLGQAALLAVRPEAAVNPFYLLVGPAWVLPLTVLATAAAIIASQALISGAFSLTSQAIQLGCLPRMAVQHTSATEKGQIYIPFVNWALMVACVLLVLAFRSSAALAGAYGIAIALTMTVTSLLFYAAARRVWHWSRWQAGLVAGGFMVIDVGFLAANSLKLLHGGLLPIVISVLLLYLIATWRWGRERVAKRLEKLAMPVALLVAEVARKPIHRVSGTAVFMSGKRSGVPLALLHHLKHNQTLHQRVLLLHVETLDTPVATDDERLAVENLGEGIHALHLRFGFSETPDVPAAMKAHLPADLKYDQGRTTFFLGRETYAVGKDTRGFDRFRLGLFSLLSHNATPATAYFQLPASRVVELGAQLTV